jgi:hypothetical protein
MKQLRTDVLEDRGFWVPVTALFALTVVVVVISGILL